MRIQRETIRLLLAALTTGERVDPVRDLFDREVEVGAAELEAAAGRRAVRDLEGLRLVVREEERVRPSARIDRVGDRLVASDLRRRFLRPDFVMGPGPSSRLLARHARPIDRGSILDLGCGTGFLALSLARPRTRLVGLDINPRAIDFARLNAGLNGLARAEFRIGDFLGDAPPRGIAGGFDVVVANPPFVLAPTRELTYRDRPLPGDEVSARTVDRVAEALAPGGRGYVLCNWIRRAGIGWSDPVRSWVAHRPVDVAAVLVDSYPADTYAWIWNRHLPEPDRTRGIAAWMASLRDEGIERVDVGLVALGRPAAGRSSAGRFTAMDRAERTVDREVIEAVLAA